MDETDEFWETYIPATPDEDKDFDPNVGKGLTMLAFFMLDGLAINAMFGGLMR